MPWVSTVVSAGKRYSRRFLRGSGPNLAQLYRSKVESLHETLKAPDTGQEAREILRELVDEVRLMSATDGSEIELIGDIAKMVEFANATGKNWHQVKFDSRTVSSVKVVAGARNCLDLLLNASVPAG